MSSRSPESARNGERASSRSRSPSIANSATRSQSNVSRVTSQIARATAAGPPRAWNSGVAPTTLSSASRERCAWSSARATWPR